MAGRKLGSLGKSKRLCGEEEEETKSIEAGQIRAFPLPSSRRAREELFSLFRVLRLLSGLDFGLRLGLGRRAHLARAPLLPPAAAARLGRRRRPRRRPGAAAALAPAPARAPPRPPAGDVGLLDIAVGPGDGRDARDVGGVASRDELGVGGDGGGGEERDCLFFYGENEENEEKRGGG